MTTLPFEQTALLDVPPQLLRLQAEQPICRVTTPAGDEAWLVTRYDDVKALFADPRLGRSHPNPEQAARISGSAMLGGAMGNYATEKEDHERMRRAFTPSFSARRMQALESRVQTMVNGLLETMALAGPPADLHEELSFPLPVMVICELLGVPYDDRQQFRQWSDAVANMRDREVATQGLTSLGGYIHQLVEGKRGQLAEDVISDLIRAQDEGTLTERQVVGFAVSLLFAGHETTVVRIDYGTLLLLANPAQRRRLLADPQVVEQAVEEILRAGTGAGAGLPRYAREDISIGDVTIHAGDAVLLSISAANHDGQRFAEPNAFDVARQPNPHLAFGYGSHYCIGASLARVELRAVFSALFGRFPTLRLAVPMDELRSRYDLLTGGIEALPVTW